MNQALKVTTPAPERIVLKRRIGSTAYNVGMFFNPDSKETLGEKVQRLLINDLQNVPENVILKPLQVGWLSERGSA
jgi:hypothetical protein